VHHEQRLVMNSGPREGGGYRHMSSEHYKGTGDRELQPRREGGRCRIGRLRWQLHIRMILRQMR
jgi:hypothetical protein